MWGEESEVETKVILYFLTIPFLVVWSNSKWTNFLDREDFNYHDSSLMKMKIYREWNPLATQMHPRVCLFIFTRKKTFISSLLGSLENTFSRILMLSISCKRVSPFILGDDLRLDVWLVPSTWRTSMNPYHPHLPAPSNLYDSSYTTIINSLQFRFKWRDYLMVI